MCGPRSCRQLTHCFSGCLPVPPPCYWREGGLSVHSKARLPPVPVASEPPSGLNATAHT
jgi:hypothetical protein